MHHVCGRDHCRRVPVRADQLIADGDIDQAKARRSAVEKENQLYGAMDGASKFVRGDAIAGLHVVFIGGFSLLALLISTQVSLGHGGYADLRLGKPWVVPALVVSMLAAIALRAAMELDPRRFFIWMALAALAFLCGALAWVMFVVPKIWQDAQADQAR